MLYRVHRVQGTLVWDLWQTENRSKCTKSTSPTPQNTGRQLQRMIHAEKSTWLINRGWRWGGLSLPCCLKELRWLLFFKEETDTFKCIVIMERQYSWQDWSQALENTAPQRSSKNRVCRGYWEAWEHGIHGGDEVQEEDVLWELPEWLSSSRDKSVL